MQQLEGPGNGHRRCGRRSGGRIGREVDEESHRVGAVSSGKTNRCGCCRLPKSPKPKILRVYVASLFLDILVCYSNSLGWYTPSIHLLFPLH